MYPSIKITHMSEFYFRFLGNFLMAMVFSQSQSPLFMPSCKLQIELCLLKVNIKSVKIVIEFLLASALYNNFYLLA